MNGARGEDASRFRPQKIVDLRDVKRPFWGLVSAVLALLSVCAAAQGTKPEAAVFSSCRGGTGAYYQVFIKEGGVRGTPRYTYIAADVELSGSGTDGVRITNPDKDVAFVFLGGNGTNGWWLDAGLQYSPLRRDWALFFWDEGEALRTAGRPFVRRATPALGPDDRFAPDQTVSLELLIPQRPVLGARRPLDHRVVVVARGRGRAGGSAAGKMQVRRYVFEVPGGWPRSGFSGGRGLNLRYTVSLAQVGGMDVTTGSYFSGTRVKNVYVGSSYRTRRPLRPSDVQRVCAYPNKRVVKVRDGRVTISYDPNSYDPNSYDPKTWGR